MLRLLLTLLLAALAGCATPLHDKRLSPGQSTAAEARSIYGLPTQVWPEADGGQTLEYAKQPYGVNCYMLRFDATGHLVSVEDALSAPNRARVVSGMSVAQVQRLLGRERTRVTYRLTGEEVWDWNVDPESHDYWKRFNVYFKNGVVVRTGETLVDPARMRWALH